MDGISLSTSESAEVIAGPAIDLQEAGFPAVSGSPQRNSTAADTLGATNYASEQFSSSQPESPQSFESDLTHPPPALWETNAQQDSVGSDSIAGPAACPTASTGHGGREYPGIDISNELPPGGLTVTCSARGDAEGQSSDAAEGEVPLSNAAEGSENEDEWEEVSEDTGDSSDDGGELVFNDSVEEVEDDSDHIVPTGEAAREQAEKRRAAESAGRPEGCGHYKRYCRLVAPCCDEIFWCRLCHDQQKSADNLDPKSAHQLDRFKVSEVVCAFCETRQAIAAACANCGKEFASYYCPICHFFDDNATERKVWHCKDCGICRIGGEENFFHCHTCGSCYKKALQGNHKCVERAMHTFCPVCLEDLFTSVQEVVILGCGHAMHKVCLQLLARSCAGMCSMRCPTCSRSLSTPTPELWADFDRAIAETPLPPDLQFEVTLFCNDCTQRSVSSFHILGLKCQRCGGYNTTRVD